MRIRGWKKFQHFKDRCPPWIKLYREEILDRRDINVISDCAFRVFINLLLLASEDKEMNGNLPCVDDIAFRLRKDKELILVTLRELESFVHLDDINMISGRYQDDAPETETETEKRRDREETDSCASTKEPKNSYPQEFEQFWTAYPKRRKKADAMKAWKTTSSARPKTDELIEIIGHHKESKEWTKDDGQFIPLPASWLRSHGWLDETEVGDIDPRGKPDQFGWYPEDKV